MSTLANALSLPGSPEAVLCRHCGTPSGQGQFCCTGCESVFAILRASGLGEYYRLKDSAYCFQPPQPVTWKGEQYAHLDSPEVRPLYLNARSEARFYIEGIHCVACLWLLEQLPRLIPGLKACRLDVSQSLLTVGVAEGTPLSAIPALIQRLGYRPHALPTDQGTEDFQREERKAALMRLGTAGACTGNLMLLAVSLYGGAVGHWGEVFRWVSFLLFLPVALYAAVPFYRTALGAVRSGSINIDVPIALAIVVGTAVSTWNLLAGSHHIYFDSLSALVFLLLASRYYLREIQARAARSSQLLQCFFNPIAHRLEAGGVHEVPPNLLAAGDHIRVDPGERIPADGRVVSGDSQINAAWLTGEALPIEVGPGDPVYAGTVNESGALVLQVSEAVADSRLGRILRQLEAEGRPSLVGMTDRASRGFLVAVLLGAFGVWLAFLPLHPAEGLNRALSLLIVTCPCALALATPLTYSYALARAFRKGHVIKQGEALERLAQVQTILFDKTGTLTHGELWVEAWEDLAGDPERNRRLLLGLEQASLHPIARALRHHLRGVEPLLFSEVQEQAGRGVRGRLEGLVFEAKAIPADGAARTSIGLFQGEELLARVSFRDRVRSEAAGAVAALKGLACQVGILSGDAEPVVQDLARQVGVGLERAWAGLSPEEKGRRVAATPHALMVGDGANDALALQQAQVGIAMHGGMDLSLKVADVYLARPDLQAVHDLVLLGRETRKVLWRNFGLSLAYNLAGGCAALLGWITPLAAAVIMPLSSITVLVSSTLSTRRVRRLFREGS